MNGTSKVALKVALTPTTELIDVIVNLIVMVSHEKPEMEVGHLGTVGSLGFDCLNEITADADAPPARNVILAVDVSHLIDMPLTGV